MQDEILPRKQSIEVSKYVKMTPCHQDEGDNFAMGYTDAIVNV